MIVEKIFQWFVDMVIDLLQGVIDFAFPDLSPDILEYVTAATDYLRAGVEVLACYTNLSYLLVLLGFVIAVDALIITYHTTMWVIKKIPIIDIK